MVKTEPILAPDNMVRDELDKATVGCVDLDDSELSELILWAQSHDDPRIEHLGQSAEARLEGLEEIESLSSEGFIANDMELQRLSVKLNLLVIKDLLENQYCGESDE